MTPDPTPEPATVAPATEAAYQVIDNLTAALDETSIELGETKRRLALRDGQLAIAGDDVRRFAAEAKAYRDAYHIARAGVETMLDRARDVHDARLEYRRRAVGIAVDAHDDILAGCGRALDRATERDKILTVPQAVDAAESAVPALSFADAKALRSALDEAAW